MPDSHWSAQTQSLLELFMECPIMDTVTLRTRAMQRGICNATARLSDLRRTHEVRTKPIPGTRKSSFEYVGPLPDSGQLSLGV